MLFIGEKEFCMQVVWFKKQKMDAFPGQRPQIFVAQDVYQVHIGFFRQKDINIYPALCCIHKAFAQHKARKEIGRFNIDRLFGLLDVIDKFVVNFFPGNEGHIPDNLEVFMSDGTGIISLAENITVVYFKILKEQLLKYGSDIVLQAQYRFAPVKVVSGNV